VCVFSPPYIGLSFYLNMLHSAPAWSSDPQCSTVENIFVGSLPVNSCYRCVELSHCGYCASTNQCLGGTVDGDDGDTCYDWSYGSCPNGYGYLSVAAMVFYLLSFGIGMGAMPWTINAEIYPLHVRSVAGHIVILIPP